MANGFQLILFKPIGKAQTSIDYNEVVTDLVVSN